MNALQPLRAHEACESQAPPGPRSRQPVGKRGGRRSLERARLSKSRATATAHAMQSNPCKRRRS
eukprot:1161067-Lingulodinium_polyedra.AAC.1